MRWDDLFRDLEAQLEAADAATQAAEVADRTRRGRAEIRLVDRLRGSLGRPVTMQVHGPGLLAGLLLDVGAGWLLAEEPAGTTVLVPMSALLTVGGLGPQAVAPGSQGAVAERLGLGHALRAVARDRAPVSLLVRDGTVLMGTLDRVGEDYVDVAEHAVGEPRRRGEVRGVRAVPMTAIGALRSS